MQIEAFTAGGIASGAVAPPWSPRDDLESEGPVDLEAATWYPLSGGAEARGRVHLEADEMLVLCSDEQGLPIHSAWHPVELDLGPYRITGELPTLPGFDPGRALSRPGGPFVLIRDVRLELLARPDVEVIAPIRAADDEDEEVAGRIDVRQVGCLASQEGTAHRPAAFSHPLYQGQLGFVR